jgi:hypothetical protein
MRWVSLHLNDRIILLAYNLILSTYQVLFFGRANFPFNRSGEASATIWLSGMTKAYRVLGSVGRSRQAGSERDAL